VTIQHATAAFPGGFKVDSATIREQTFYACGPKAGDPVGFADGGREARSADSPVKGTVNQTYRLRRITPRTGVSF
jgi:hypothetical protein